VHSRRIDPIKRSTCPFCQGEQNDVGLSLIPIARNRALNATPNARSLSRMRYFGALSHGNASVIAAAGVCHLALSPRMADTYMADTEAGKMDATAAISKLAESDRGDPIYPGSQGRSFQRLDQAGRFSRPCRTSTFLAVCAYATHDLSLRIFRDAR